MAFEYSAFISYRHGRYKLAHKIINDLFEAISSELELLRTEKVFIDRGRMKGGAFHEKVIAEALCKSVCMIVVFTPTYFNKDFPYCAREFRAMELMEKQRLLLLHGTRESVNGLIIPIVFRGDVPEALKPRFLS